MILSESINRNGKIPTYYVEDDLKNLLVDLNKPSARICQTQIGLKTLSLLRKIEKNNNHSWYSELYERSSKDLGHVALFYRGNKITYGEMFEKADAYAKSLAKFGIKKGDEVPCCLANTPELVYFMLAINKIGAKLNLVSENFNSHYLQNILSDTNSKMFIATDNNYAKIEKVVDQIGFDKIVLVSLADSLPTNPKECDEYEPLLDRYYHYNNYVSDFKNKNSSIVDINEFEEYGKDYANEIIDQNDLNTEFTITYTSGSTRKGFPKGMVHSNKSYIVGGIYNDSNLTGSPSVPEIRGLAHIHSDSNTNLVTCISDNLMKHGVVALEPEYDKEKFLDYVLLNKPVHLDATTSFLVKLAKDYLCNKKYQENGKKLKFPSMLVTMAVGEPTSPGEEKFINTFLRKSAAGSGIKLNGLSLPFAPLSIGGGDCEHGGIYYTLLKQFQHIKSYSKILNEEYGLTPVPFAVVTALKKMEDGSYEECNYGEKGIIVANSITSMISYKNDIDKTKNKIIRDRYGRDWLSCDVYGYINKIGNVIVNGRIEDVINIKYENYDISLPMYEIDNIVNKDTKNIMSCSSVKVDTQTGEKLVINVEFSPFMKKNKEKVLISMKKRLEKTFPYINEFYVRIIDNEQSFVLTGSGKRDIKYLQQLGLKDTFCIINEKTNFFQKKYLEDNEKQLYLKK